MDYLHSNHVYLNNLCIEHLLIDAELNVKLINLCHLSRDNTLIDQFYMGSLLYYLITSEKIEHNFNFVEEKEEK